ncbi:MAG: SMP-30/gluconolactonase/LRE family protein [Pseudomonadota bacterium]
MSTSETIRADLIATVPCQCQLGEGVLWDARLGQFLWTDIQGKALHSYCLKNGDHRVVRVPHRLASFALTHDPGVLLAAFDQCLGSLDRETGKVLSYRFKEPILTPGTRFNDGKVGPHGRFWVGTMVEDAEKAGGRDAGILYRLIANGVLSPERRGISISNGLAWAPDLIHFYFADSPKQQIWRFEQSQYIWTIASEAPFATISGDGYPDGATTSTDGRYWSALWGAGEVRVFDPDGTVAGQVTVPARQPSCCAFGGDDYSILAVTSAREGLSDTDLAEYTEAGNLFLYQTNAKGFRSFRFGEKAI